MASSNINEKVQQALEEGHPWESIKAHLGTIDSPEAKSYLSGLQSASSAQTDTQPKATASSIKTGLLNFIEQNPEEAALYGAGAYALLQTPKIISKVADYRLKQRELGLKERSLTAYESQVAKQGVAPESLNPANELIESVRQNEFQKQSPLNAYAEQKYGVPLADLEKASGGKLKTTTDVDVVGGAFSKGGGITVNPAGAFTQPSSYVKTPVAPTDGPFFNPNNNAPVSTTDPFATRPNPYMTPSVQEGVETGNTAKTIQSVVAKEIDKTVGVEPTGMKPNYNKTKKNIGPGAYNWLAGQEGPKAPEVWRNLVGEKNIPYNEFMEKVKPVYEGYIGSYGEPDPFKQAAKPGEYKRPSMVPENIRGSSNLKGLAGLAGTAGLLMAATTPESKAAMARASEAIKDIGISPESILGGKGDELGRMGNAYVSAGNPNYLRELKAQLDVETNPERRNILLREFQKIGGSGAGRGIAPPSAYMR